MVAVAHGNEEGGTVAQVAVTEVAVTAAVAHNSEGGGAVAPVPVAEAHSSGEEGRAVDAVAHNRRPVAHSSSGEEGGAVAHNRGAVAAAHSGDGVAAAHNRGAVGGNCASHAKAEGEENNGIA